MLKSGSMKPGLELHPAKWRKTYNEIVVSL